jgi:hypothetical protein
VKRVIPIVMTLIFTLVLVGISAVFQAFVDSFLHLH